MSPSPPAPPSLDVLRKEIDTHRRPGPQPTDAARRYHDRLISVKQTQEVGSAFRPAREADMMRRLVQRHRGILPLDTVESIWRVIISTFTYVQAPFSSMQICRWASSRCGIPRGFISDSPFPRLAFERTRRGRRGGRVEGRSRAGLRHRQPHPMVDRAGSRGAPKIIARLPFVERADHPAAFPVFVVSRVAEAPW